MGSGWISCGLSRHPPSVVLTDPAMGLATENTEKFMESAESG
jgi:hypothetical protein